MATTINFNPFIDFELYRPVAADFQSQLEEVQSLSKNYESYAKWVNRFACVAYPTALILCISIIAYPAILFSLPSYTLGLVLTSAGLVEIARSELASKSRHVILKKTTYIYEAANKMMDKVIGEEDELNTKITIDEAKQRCAKIKAITEQAVKVLSPFLQDSEAASVNTVTTWKGDQDNIGERINLANIKNHYDNSLKRSDFIIKTEMNKGIALCNYKNIISNAQSSYNVILSQVLINDSN